MPRARLRAPQRRSMVSSRSMMIGLPLIDQCCHQMAGKLYCKV